MESIPDTHLFVYNGKQYLIKFDFYKYLQEYFKRNQAEIGKSQIIQLIDEEDEENLNFSGDWINSFINYVIK